MAHRTSARAELEALWAARAAHYEAAAVVVDTSAIAADDVVDIVADAVAARFGLALPAKPSA